MVGGKGRGGRGNRERQRREEEKVTGSEEKRVSGLRMEGRAERMRREEWME